MFTVAGFKLTVADVRLARNEHEMHRKRSCDSTKSTAPATAGGGRPKEEKLHPQNMND